MSSSDRDYISGATVRLTTVVREPRTGAPLDPPGGVTLDTLIVGTMPLALPANVTFTRITPGEYVLSLQTVGFVAGTYTWRARAVDANGDVALAEDTFVIRGAF